MTADPILEAVVFLADHPAWTWRDLAETPDDVLDALKSYQRSREGNGA